MAQKRKRSTSPLPDNANIFRSEPIADRTSTFIGYFSPTLTPKKLQGLEEVKSASHKMLGWRRESNQQSLTAAKQYVTGNDDDGEKYGGKRVEQVLKATNITGSCVVARWYGGVMLGPVRFTHIESCAREAVRRWQDSLAEEKTKKRRVEEEAHEKKKMLRVLSERDQSITVLRTLAVEKEGLAKQSVAEVNTDQIVMIANGAVEGTPTKVESPSQSQTSPKVAISYDDMPLDRLKALEKARDATLSFLLKRIDKAEIEIREKKGPTTKGEPP